MFFGLSMELKGACTMSTHTKNVYLYYLLLYFTISGASENRKDILQKLSHSQAMQKLLNNLVPINQQIVKPEKKESEAPYKPSTIASHTWETLDDTGTIKFKQYDEKKLYGIGRLLLLVYTAHELFMLAHQINGKEKNLFQRRLSLDSKIRQLGFVQSGLLKQSVEQLKESLHMFGELWPTVCSNPQDTSQFHHIYAFVRSNTFNNLVRMLYATYPQLHKDCEQAGLITKNGDPVLPKLISTSDGETAKKDVENFFKSPDCMLRSASHIGKFISSKDRFLETLKASPVAKELVIQYLQTQLTNAENKVTDNQQQNFDILVQLDKLKRIIDAITLKCRT